MFGVGLFELIVIAVVAIIFVGPERLPEFLHKAGRLYVQARRMTNEVRGAFNNAIYQVEEEIRQEKAAALKKLLEEQRALQDSLKSTDQDANTAQDLAKAEETAPTGSEASETPHSPDTKEANPQNPPSLDSPTKPLS